MKIYYYSRAARSEEMRWKKIGKKKITAKKLLIQIWTWNQVEKMKEIFY